MINKKYTNILNIACSYAILNGCLFYLMRCKQYIKKFNFHGMTSTFIMKLYVSMFLRREISRTHCRVYYHLNAPQQKSSHALFLLFLNHLKRAILYNIKTNFLSTTEVYD